MNSMPPLLNSPTSAMDFSLSQIAELNTSQQKCWLLPFGPQACLSHVPSAC